MEATRNSDRSITFIDADGDAQTHMPNCKCDWCESIRIIGIADFNAAEAEDERNYKEPETADWTPA